MKKPIIEVRNLNKIFEVKQKQAGFWGSLKSVVKTEKKIVKAVNDVSFSVNAGEVVAFIGPNGAGKSTVIKMLAGILYPSGGEISVLGFNPSKDRKKLAYHIGSVFGQKSQLWYHLPARDTFNLLGKIYELDPKEHEERLKFLVDSFEIGDLLSTPVRKLSLGQRMRCEIVASLLHRPKIIFLDEPTIGLDIISKRQVREMIKFLNEKEGVTIFLTSHDAGDVETLAERTIVIDNGTVIFDDKTNKLKEKYLRSKVIEVMTEQKLDGFEFPEGKIMEKDEYHLKIEIDTQTASIEKLLNYVVRNYTVQDINIFDPPMEEIISEIYQKNNE
jgi:ABC-2 type transport system ATP-binding protein